MADEQNSFQEEVISYDALLEMIEHHSPRAANTRIVAIDGPGGAGKTTLASALCDKLINVDVVHLDDFASWDNPLNWWPRVLEQVLEPLSLGQSVHYQRYDWVKRRLDNWIDLDPLDILILEGVSASRVAFRPYLTFAIWIQTPLDICLERGVKRDGEEVRQQWIEGMDAENEYVREERPIEYANLIVSGMPKTFHERTKELVRLRPAANAR
jgi:uridine kinase